MLTLLVFQFLTPRPRPNGEHRQDCQRRESEFRIAQRRPSQGCQHRIRAHRYQELIHHYCPERALPLPTSLRSVKATARKTGAQGRIRTSVARKERQIYSLLPLTTRPPVHSHPIKRNPGARWGPRFDRAFALKRRSFESRIAEARNRLVLLSKNVNSQIGSSGKTRQQPRDQTSARLTNGEAAAGFSSLGELRVSFGLLLLRLAARSKVPILELAKGFEPPTL